MNIRYRKTCRVCGSSSLRQVIDLGPQYLQGAFVHPDAPAPPLRKVPCTLVRCDPKGDESACGLLQMQASVSPEILYSSYWYRSGTNQTMRDHLAGIAKAAMEVVPRTRQLTVLDIGCNDGTLLRNYPKHWLRVGIDPSNAAQEDEANRIRVITDSFPSPLLAKSGFTKFDIVTSIAMFYDLEDPVGFASAVARLLNPGGVWILEVSYMPRMLELNSYDTICHEHLEYYSLEVIEQIMWRAGLRVFRAEFNECNGGSIRCYVAHTEFGGHDRAEWKSELRAIRAKEFDLALDTDHPYREFAERADKHAKELHELIAMLHAGGKKIHIYGASTKGNTLLQYCRIDASMIVCAADRNPEKHGARTLGTGIPIVSEDESRALNPDYYLVLPWHFREEFLARESAMCEAGVGFIFPLPEIIVHRKIKQAAA